MEAQFADVNWLAVGVSTIISFILSGLWYSPKMFGTKWAKGVGVNVDADAKQPMPALVTQFIGTLLFACCSFGLYEWVNSIDSVNKYYVLLFISSSESFC